MKKRALSLLVILTLCFSTILVFTNTSQAIDIPVEKLNDSKMLFNTVLNQSNKLTDITNSISSTVNLKNIQIELEENYLNENYILNTEIMNLDKLLPLEATAKENENSEENHPPIASLKYAIINPDSLIDNNITTDTQIAWLWSYNGENYISDPDGDKITDINIDGIPSDAFLGYLKDNIGFATKFNEPGQYILRFKCMDEHGLWSNIWSIAIPVESTDGNKRPNCVINYSTLTGTTEDQFIWGWFNSTDPDGDSITNIEGTVVKNGEYISINDYIINQDADGCATKFSEAGIYTLMFRVKDSRGAWSDWVSLDITVTESIPTEITNVVIISNSDDDYKYYYCDMYVDKDDYVPRRGIWINEKIGFEAIQNNETIHYAPTFEPYNSYGVMHFNPREYSAEELIKIFAIIVKERKIVNNGFTVKGETNKPNTTIAVAFDLFGKLISDKIKTDSDGNFTITFPDEKIPESNNTTYAWYGNLTTIYIEPSTVRIIMPNKTKNIPVYVVTGAFLGKVDIHNPNNNISGHCVLKSFLKIGEPGYWESLF